MADIIIGARPLIAHIMQIFRLANDLKNRGPLVTYVLAASHLRHLVESQGLNFYHLNYPSNPAADRTSSGPLDAIPPVGQIRHMRRQLQQACESLLESSIPRAMVDALAPDMMIIDSTAI